MPAFIDIISARQNKEHLAKSKQQTDAYYKEQDHILSQWEWGKPTPKNLVLGELPEANLLDMGISLVI